MIVLQDLLKGKGVKRILYGWLPGAGEKERRTTVVRLFGAIILIAALLFGSGACAPPPVSEEVCVIRAGAVCLSKTEFAEELDLKLTAYPYDIKDMPEAYNQMVLDLVAVLSDETVLLAGAAEKGITLSQELVDQAESEFKKDYPEDSFEQMLLENAIPYRIWKRRLLKDLTIQSFLQDHLVDSQEITPDDMIAFYNQFRQQAKDASPAASDMSEGRLVEMLRLEKSQAAYDSWIASLKQVYPVTIDRNQLSEFLITN